jgi:hypothetical protein
MIPPNLSLALHTRAELLYGQRKMTFTRYPFADVVLPTGEIVACDPLVGEEASFVHAVAPGTYPVFLTICDLASPGDKADHRVVYATLLLRAAEPARWQIAGQHTVTQYGHQGAYFVDTGMGCFMDRATADALRPRFKADREYYEQVAKQTHQKDPAAVPFPVEHLITCLDHRLEDPATGNCVMFGSGVGDGEYFSYWGDDAAGAPLCLVTDFAVFNPTKLRVLHTDP